MNASRLLFVYGSLKRGGVNFSVMAQARARFLGQATTLRPLFLEQGPRWRRLYGRPGVGARVTGELFIVDSENGWRVLDEFEGHPHGYRRRLESVIDPAQQVRNAWIYFYVPERTGV